MFNAWAGSEAEVCNHQWRFGKWEFDEFSRELRAGGRPVEIESKPLDVLHQLLLHAGEVVTREELLDSVWPGVTVVDGSLATAVSKLRKIFADEESSIVLTVPRIGYRLGVPVQAKQVAPPDFHPTGLRAGDAIPGREQWILNRRLDRSSAGPASVEVWLAEHSKTREARVFKFALDGVRLRSLKREVTLARLLRDSLGDRQDFAHLLEWNFDAPPFFLESEYGGQNLAEWAESQGGLAGVAREFRLQLIVQAARAVAAAHEVGVLHKDLTPGNILVTAKPEGGWQARVVDFGSGTLTEPARLKALGITNLGFTETLDAEAAALTGTMLYMPPEVLAGQSPTASADVYSLGVLLYQMMAGDFRKPLSSGWESSIDDALIRDDIADATWGDPRRRLSTVAALAERLENLDARRTERNLLNRALEQAQAAERRLAASRARQPWIVAAGIVLMLGLGISLALYRKASVERERANRETEIAASINRFLADDLLGRGNPFQSGRSDETLVSAMKQSAADIDRQFAVAPEVAAPLHHAIARALDTRTEYVEARREYDRAAALYVRAQGPLSPDAIVARLQLAAAEARSYEAGSLPRARAILATQQAIIAKISRPRDDLAVWLASARGMIALIGNDAKETATQFQIASERAAALADFDVNARLTFQQRLAFAYIRLGDGVRAERLIRELIAAFSRTDGPDSPHVLRVRLNLAQAFMIQGKNREAIQETTAIYPAYVSRLGEEHELSMQLLATRAQCEGTMGLWEDAIRDDLAVNKLATRKQGPQSFFAVATLTDAALAQCRGGHAREGEANARAAFETSVKAFGERAGLTGGAAYTLAACSISGGKLEEALRLLEGIDEKAVAQLTGIPDWSANVALARAEIALREGDYSAAGKYVESASPAFSRADSEPYQKQKLASLRVAVERRSAAR